MLGLPGTPRTQQHRVPRSKPVAPPSWPGAGVQDPRGWAHGSGGSETLAHGWLPVGDWGCPGSQGDPRAWAVAAGLFPCCWLVPGPVWVPGSKQAGTPGQAGDTAGTGAGLMQLGERRPPFLGSGELDLEQELVTQAGTEEIPIGYLGKLLLPRAQQPLKRGWGVQSSPSHPQRGPGLGQGDG